MGASHNARQRTSVFTRANHASPPLRPRTQRVLMGVVTLTSTWTRLTDRVGHDQLAAACGVTDRRALRRELRELADRGLIVYTPGSGRTRSVLGLPDPLDANPPHAP